MCFKYLCWLLRHEEVVSERSASEGEDLVLAGRGIKLGLEEPLGNVYGDVAIQNGGGVQGTN